MTHRLQKTCTYEPQIADPNSNNIGLHLIAPYVGKIRPVLARHLINSYTSSKSVVYDPFCGSGTVPFEAWTAGRTCFATDLNDYAIILTKGKLKPFKSLEAALLRLDKINNYLSRDKVYNIDRSVPEWVSSFFHPRTLSESIAWSVFLKERREWFILSCLMGILHHQRPGFLSFPSSHGAPYLRDSKYPKDKFPQLYEYRDVYSRLKSKIVRTYKNFPELNYNIERDVRKVTAATVNPPMKRIHTIITSPPYMKSLTYARDNRLRLWFLGKNDWKSLENKVSPTKTAFSELISNSFLRWKSYQQKGDHCIIIIGDIAFNKEMRLPEFVTSKANEAGYKLELSMQDPIPDKKRFNKSKSRIASETILVFARRS
jgi:D12 class N6 adenine-specific DNA methyltransferase